MSQKGTDEILALLQGSITLQDGSVEIVDEEKLRQNIHKLAEISALEKGERQGLARYMTRLVALAFGSYPASIHELYLARGRGELPTSFTVPAINLRALTFEAARAVFRSALAMNASAFIFEIARSEMGYTDQRPAEYVTSILAAAINEGYKGPVFIQGDHFQISAKRYTADPDAEVQSVRELIEESIEAGFFNIDIDTSTLVDLSKDSVNEQQYLNSFLSATLTAYVRSLEPQGITISVGGEIGEVGGQNSTEEELCAYMDGYITELQAISPALTGISKISIQTGTSHGGVVLPDGSIAQVSVDFDTMQKLSRVAREEFGLGGAVQHGASTLPEAAFGKFVEAEAVEIHLATNFQNMLFELVPSGLRNAMYAFCNQKYSAERKEGMTDEQFYYKTRKNAIGPFKGQTWGLQANQRAEIGYAWEMQFIKLFNLLGIRDSRKFVEQTVRSVAVMPQLSDYIVEEVEAGEVSDLAD